MYCLTSSIKIGDIVLLSGGAKHSKVISFVTHGPFSHACLVVGPSQIIEALTSSGVQYTSCTKIVVSDRSSIAILRPKFSDEARAQAVRSDIEELAKAHQSRDYSILDALKLPIQSGRVLAADKYFCSYLVSAIYREAEFPLFDEKHDHNVSPNDFLNCTLLEDVTNDVVIKMHDYIQRRMEKRGITPPGLDARGSTESEYALLFREFIEDAGPIFKARGIRPPSRMFDIIDVLTDPAHSSEAGGIDQQLTSLFDSTNILALLRADAASEPDDLDELKEEISVYGRRFIDEEYSWCVQTMESSKKKMESYLVYKNMFSQVHRARGFDFASRMSEYYRLMIMIGHHIQQDIQNRAALLLPHLEYYP